MDECYSYLIDFKKIKLLVWSSISTQHAEAADIIFLRAVARQGWYAEILEQVHPRLVIPTHWDNLFLPLSRPIRPYLAPPTIRNPFIRQINLDDFKNKIFVADPACKILVPQIFQPYDLLAEIG